LSLHDALPIWHVDVALVVHRRHPGVGEPLVEEAEGSVAPILPGEEDDQAAVAHAVLGADVIPVHPGLLVEHAPLGVLVALGLRPGEVPRGVNVLPGPLAARLEDRAPVGALADETAA